MNSWETFDEELLPEKEAFYSSLNMEVITDVDYIYAKGVYKEFNNKSLGDYHGLYVQSDTSLLANLVENLELNVLKYMKLILLNFYQHLDWHGKHVLKRQE